MMCVLKFKRVDKRDGRINRCGAASAAIEMFCDTFLEAVRRTAVGNTRFQSQYVKPGRHVWWALRLVPRKSSALAQGHFDI
jgi:hypothetical protein